MNCDKCNQGRNNCDCVSTNFEWTVMGVLLGALLLWVITKFV